MSILAYRSCGYREERNNRNERLSGAGPLIAFQSLFHIEDVIGELDAGLSLTLTILGVGP